MENKEKKIELDIIKSLDTPISFCHAHIKDKNYIKELLILGNIIKWKESHFKHYF
jgi:hypothetical protein